MGPDMTMSSDEYLEQIAQLRNNGMKGLETFKTPKEVEEQKKKQLLAQTK